MKAIPPKMELERGYNDERFDNICDTCHCHVVQPVIKGIWFHERSNYAENSNQCDHHCTNLVPVKSESHNRDAKWHCKHQYRFVDGMTYAIKCIKCQDVLRHGLIGLYNHKGEYHCIPCDKDLKYIEKHANTIHKGKLFEYDG